MAHKFKVPILIGLNTMDVEGTLIKEYDEYMEINAVTGLSVNENILMVSASNVSFDAKIISKIFSKIAEENIIVDMISQTAPYNDFINISFTVEKDDKHDLIKVISNLKADMPNSDFSFNEELVKLSVVGIGMISQSGVAAKLFNVFSENNILFYQVTTSEISISYTVHSDDLDKAISIIAKLFNL